MLGLVNLISNEDDMATTKKTTKTDTKKSNTENINYAKPVTDFPFVYANNAALTFSKLDASLLFGELVGEDEEGKIIVIPKAKVIMALPFVRELRDLLTRQIDAFEKDYGEIPSLMMKKTDPKA